MTARRTKTRPPSPTRRPRRARGLTLMETALATVIVGLAVLALVNLIAATNIQTSYSQKQTTAFMLANQIREAMVGMPFNDPLTGTHAGGPNTGQTNVSQFNDVEDFDGYVASPPIDSHRQPITTLGSWQQSVSVTLIGDNNGANLNSTTGNLGAIVERVRVTISYRAPSEASWTPITTLSWLKTKY